MKIEHLNDNNMLALSGGGILGLGCGRISAAERKLLAIVKKFDDDTCGDLKILRSKGGVLKFIFDIQHSSTPTEARGDAALLALWEIGFFKHHSL